MQDYPAETSGSSGLLAEEVQRGPVDPLVSSFLTHISNEFRTPLAALNACVEYLLHDFEALSREEINVLLESIHFSVTGLSTLMENLLQSANIEAGQLLICTGPINLGDVVAEAIHAIYPLIRRRRQRVIVEQPGTMPLVQGDPARLTQVLVNLISSASKLGPMNQTITVILDAGAGDEVRVNIIDQFSGFLSREEQTVIDHFGKPAAAGAAVYGDGLATAVARLIVKEHGGKVGVDWRPGDGVNMWFTVPSAQTIKRGTDDHSNESD